MSGVELPVAIIALLETALKVSQSLHRAYKQKKGIPDAVQGVQDKLENIKTVVEAVRDEEALRTPKVATHLAALQGRVAKLREHLATIDPTRKSAFRQFFHQLASGAEDEKAIEKLLRDLEQGKSSLIIAIQVVVVGFGKDRQGNDYVDITSAKRVDDFLRKRLGHDKGLKVMGLIEDRGQGGRIPLSEDDLDNLGSLIQASTDDRTGTERRILNNVTQFQALQINTPVGKDIWANIDRLVIENNRAAGLSTQVNYPITLDIFYALLMNKLGVALLFFCVLYFQIVILFGRGH